jgi:general secretion pathway protein G
MSEHTIMKQRRGFTLIELLVVIAIIAILAAIIVPAIVRTKDAAYRNQDMSNMNLIRSALQQYKVDQGGYPPALLGYVTLYTSGPNMGQVIPANALQGFLYSKRIQSIATLQPAFERSSMVATTNAFWPGVSAPTFGACSTEGRLQAYDSDETGFVADSAITGNNIPTTNAPDALNFYKVSGYDVAEAFGPSGLKKPELRYTLFWTTWGLGVNGCGYGSGSDDPRQLGYDDPPETTVVTWNSYFREGTTVPPAPIKRDSVLFLGGSARMMDTRNVYDMAWGIRP